MILMNVMNKKISVMYSAMGGGSKGNKVHVMQLKTWSGQWMMTGMIVHLTLLHSLSFQRLQYVSLLPTYLKYL